MTTKGQRLPYLDLLRGIAVLGLVLMNITHMGMFDIGYVNFEPALTSDAIVKSINSMFFDGRFRSLFCLLFGIGLYLQSQSYLRQQLDVQAVLRSRVGWLLVFGLIHCIFIWPGDILILYALAGYFMIKRLDWSEQKLIKRGLLFFAIGILIYAIEVVLTAYFDETTTRSSSAFLESYDLLVGPYWGYILINLMIALVYILTFPLLSLFYICGIMMLGIGLFKSGKLKTGFERREVMILLAITVFFSAMDVISSLYSEKAGTYGGAVLGSVSGLSMALLIWHWVISSNLANRVSWLVEALKRAGQMAFTLYILQSVVLVALFRFAFPEWNLYFHRVNYLTLGLMFIAVQLLFAYAYKSTGRQGPLEALWRNLVITKIREQVPRKAEKGVGPSDEPAVLRPQNSDS